MKRTNTTELTLSIAQEAQKVIVITPQEASKKYHGLMARVLPAMLKNLGYHTCNIDGVKTLFIAR